MAETYVTLSSLKHYDEKIKEVIDEKQDQLVGTEGQVVSFDENGNVISKDLEMIDTSAFAKNEDLNKKLDKQNPTGTGSLSFNRKDSTSVGDYSVAIGDRTTATGKASLAEGCLTSATAPQSHAEGDGTMASGIGAHAEGGYVDGVYTTASGTYAHAEGVGTTASEAGTHTEGYKTTATAPYAHAEGYEAKATGGVSHAEGFKTTASGLRSHAEGIQSQTGANATAAHAEGWSTQALGVGSHAEGVETIAEGNYSHAEGGNNTAKGKYQHVEGLYNDKIKQILVPGIKWTSCSANLVVSISNMYNSLGVSTNHSDANYTYDNVSYKYKVRCDASKFDNISNLTGSTSNHYRGYIYFASTDANDIYDNILLVREDGTVTIYYNNNEIYNQRTWFGTTVYPSCDIGISEADTGTGVDSYTTPDLTATHVQGKYSYVDKSYAHIVGGGTSDSNRKNIHTLDWDGNAEYLGDVKATKKDGTKVSLVEVASRNSGEINVQSDWNETSSNSDAYIKNKPIIPSIEGLVSEDTLNTTLNSYAKKSDLPDEYDDTALKNRVTQTETAITTLNGTGDGSVSKTVNNALNDFATKISNDNVVNTYKELVDYAAENSSEIAEMVGNISKLQTDIANKVDKENGKGLSTNDLTSTLKSNYDKAYTHSQAAHAPSNAEKNQNAFGYVLANGTIISAQSQTDSLYITGKNIEVTDSTSGNSEVIIEMTKDNVVSALGYTPSNDTPMGTCTTAKNDSTKVVSAIGYSESENAIITVRFTNDVGANASIKVNDGVAHPIRHIGGLIKDGVICAENLATFKHVGDYYYLIAVNDSTSTCMKKENPSGTGTFSMNSSTASGTYSASIGAGTVASGQAAFSQGYSTQAKGVCSVATGYENISFGNYSLVEGSYNNKVESFAKIDELSVACSCDSVNSTSLLHDGIEYTKSARVYVTSNINPSKTSTTGYYKGRMVNTSNSYVVSDLLIYYPGSSIEVYSTSNSLMNFAGINTLTLYFEKAEIPPSTDSTHIQGKYSLIDGDYAHVVGNGTSDSNRSNAHTLDWKGNATFAGDVKATDASGNTVSLLDVASKSNDGGTLPPYYVGTCSTSAGTANKIVTISNFELKVGVEVHVKFTYTNTSSSATLNVSSTGAKAMYYKNGDRMYYIPADVYHTFVYDGTYWRYLDSDNVIIGARSYERYGLKMNGSALVPIISGYTPTLGNTSNKFGTIYTSAIGTDSYPATSIYGDGIYANELYTKTGSYRTKVLPSLPLLYGNFTVSSYHTITFNSSVCQNYVKSLYTNYLNTNADVTSSGCAYAGSAQGNTYDVAFLFRVIGYDSTSGKQAVPFVQEFALTTAYTTMSCGDNSTDWYVFKTPCGNTVYFYLTGISVDSCGYVSGTPALNIGGTTSSVHFSEIALMP